MNFVFNPKPLVIGKEHRSPSTNELESCVLFDYTHYDEVLQGSTEFIKSVLTSAPLAGDRRHIYVDVRVHSLKKGDAPHPKPGWHCGSTVAPDRESDELHHIFVTGTKCLTQFIGEPVTLNYKDELSPNEALEDLREQLEITYPNLKVIEVPSCKWVTYGPHDFHRVKNSDGDETRLLVRIRETSLSRTPIAALQNRRKAQRKLPPAADVIPGANKKMNVVFRLVLQKLSATQKSTLKSYLGFLEETYNNSPPPYGQGWYGELFRELAIDPNWLAANLLANALKECDGAKKAFLLASGIPKSIESDFRLRTFNHGKDEERHAYHFLQLLNTLYLVQSWRKSF